MHSFRHVRGNYYAAARYARRKNSSLDKINYPRRVLAPRTSGRVAPAECSYRGDVIIDGSPRECLAKQRRGGFE